MINKLSCVIIDDDTLSIKILSALIEKTATLDLQKTFTNPIKASEYLLENHVDLLFLDVEMPEMTGLDFLGTLDYKPQVVIVSTHEKYASKAFELEATDYLVKPINDISRFITATQRVVKNHELKSQTTSDNLFLKVDSVLINFNLTDIDFIEAYGDYVKVHAHGKVYTIYATLKSLENTLPTNSFVRIHRSYIVRLDKIKSIDISCLQVAEETIPISNTYKPQLLAKIKTL